ncbi:MAG: hypothetical protein QMC37_04130, partial [Flavobacteriales bacterium]
MEYFHLLFYDIDFMHLSELVAVFPSHDGVFGSGGGVFPIRNFTRYVLSEFHINFFFCEIDMLSFARVSKREVHNVPSIASYPKDALHDISRAAASVAGVNVRRVELLRRLQSSFGFFEYFDVVVDSHRDHRGSHDYVS